MDHFRRTFLVLKVIRWQLHEVLVVEMEEEKEEEEKKRRCTYVFAHLFLQKGSLPSR